MSGKCRLGKASLTTFSQVSNEDTRITFMHVVLLSLLLIMDSYLPTRTLSSKSILLIFLLLENLAGTFDWTFGENLFKVTGRDGSRSLFSVFVICLFIFVDFEFVFFCQWSFHEPWIFNTKLLIKFYYTRYASSHEVFFLVSSNSRWTLVLWKWNKIS